MRDERSHWAPARADFDGLRTHSHSRPDLKARPRCRGSDSGAQTTRARGRVCCASERYIFGVRRFYAGSATFLCRAPKPERMMTALGTGRGAPSRFRHRQDVVLVCWDLSNVRQATIGAVDCSQTPWAWNMPPLRRDRIGLRASPLQTMARSQRPRRCVRLRRRQALRLVQHQRAARSAPIQRR